MQKIRTKQKEVGASKEVDTSQTTDHSATLSADNTGQTHSKDNQTTQVNNTSAALSSSSDARKQVRIVLIFATELGLDTFMATCICDQSNACRQFVSGLKKDGY